MFKLHLFYNDYETSYTTYINHARWHRCLRADGFRVGGNWSARRKPTCLTWWPHDHLTCWQLMLLLCSELIIYSILIYSFHRSHVSFQMIVMTQWCLNDIYTILCFCCFIYYCYNVHIDISTWDVSSEFWFCRNNCARVCVMVCGNYYTFHFLNCSRWVSVSNECSVKQM